MRTFIGILSLMILIRCSSARQEKLQEFEKSGFEKVSFDKAMINGEEASRFFIKNILISYNSAPGGYTDGNVFVSFIISKTGQLDSISIINEPNEMYEEMVINAFKKSSGLWSPTRFDDLALDKKYVAGFNFAVTNSVFYKKDKSFQYYKKGNMEKALKLINEVIKIDPYDIELYLDRALIYKKQSRHDLEILDLAKCYELNNNLLFDIWFEAN
jgi:tetratricopeptide (TPR) repeat protein